MKKAIFFLLAAAALVSGASATAQAYWNSPEPVLSQKKELVYWNSPEPVLSQVGLDYWNSPDPV